MARLISSPNAVYDLTKDFTTSTGKSYVSSKSLYAWYQFEQDISSSGNLTDLSGNGFDLQPEHDPADRPAAPTSDSPGSSASPTGFPSKSAVFSLDLLEYPDSGDAFTFGDGTSDSPITVSAWVKLTDNGTHYLLSKYDNTGTQREWLFLVASGTQLLRFHLTDESNNNTNYVSSNVHVPLNVWVHVAATYDGRGGPGNNALPQANEGITLYMNGVDVTDRASANASIYVAMENTTSNFGIGNRDDESATLDLDGSLAQAAVWSKALTSTEISALYDARTGLKEKMSGISSPPARVQLREIDQLGGQYPLNYRLGDHDAQRSISSLPFDDTNTQTFLSNYATAKIFLSLKEDGPLFPGTYIDLTGSNGNTSKRFKFIQSPAIPGCTVDSSDVKIILTNPVGTPIEERMRNIASRLAIAIRKQTDLEIEVDHRSPVVDRYDEEGEKLVNRTVRHTLVLKHKVPGRGSYDQGNRIVTKIPLPGGTGESSNPPGVKINQFKIPTTKPVALGTLSAFDGQGSSIISMGHLSPDIVSSGSMIPGITDSSYVTRTNYVLSPFNESRIPSFQDTDFDNVGTDPSIIEGFESRLSSKTIVKIKCKTSNFHRNPSPIFYATGAVGETPLGTYTPIVQGRIGSGFAYWNDALGRWEMKGVSSTAEEVSPFAGGTRLRAQSALGYTLNPSSSRSAETNYSFFATNDFWNRDVIANLNGVSMPTSTYGFPNGAQYNATGSQEILLSNHISYPFLLEKIKVSVKGVFGVATSSLNRTENLPINKTFFILNQKTSGDFPHVSGTINVFNKRQTSSMERFFSDGVDVPSRGSREIITWGKIGFLEKSSIIYTQENEQNLKALYEDYDLITKFDKSVNSPSYTGSLNLSLVPKLGLSSDATSISTTMDQFGYVRPIVQSNLHGGADLEGNASGRQIVSSLGGAKIVGSGSSIFSYLSDSPTLGAKLVERESHYQQSPYLLFPEDRLIFGWQNLMPIAQKGSSTGYTSQAQGDTLADRIEEVDITLYGSMIQQGREMHDTLNQNLSSNQIHELIFGEHVVDQYEVEPISVLSGSTLDALFFGSMFQGSTLTRTTGVRGRRASIAKGEAGSTGSLQRNIGIKGGGSFKDSLTPHLEFFLTHPTFFTSSATSGAGVSESVTVPGAAAPYRSIVLSSNPVSSSFKLLKVIGLHQLVNPVGQRPFTANIRKFPASDFLTPPGSGKVTDAKFLSFDMSTSGAAKYKIFSGTLDYAKGVKSFGSPEISTLPQVAPPRLFESTSQKLAISSLFFAAPIVSMFGSLTWPVYPLGTGGVTPLIRGLKYGLSNTTPTSPRTYFRRTSYGQFRDLMDQAPETAVVDLIDDNTGEVDLEAADGPVRVRFFARNGTPDISPLDTNSQNLSQFATSSFPFYDGSTKERDVVNFPPPDDTDKIGVEEATLALVDGDA